MRGKTVIGLLGAAAVGTLALLFWVTGGTASEYHNGGTLLCYDCHTMHYSMQHGWDGGTVGTTPVGNSGNWLGTGGPNAKLVKGSGINELCLGCHNGTTIAPDVLHSNTSTYAREAGALNDGSGGEGYASYMGHTLGSTNDPPGYNPAVLGAWWTSGTSELECTSCHSAHGGTQYRGLGPYGKPNVSLVKPTYAISTTAPTSASIDVWINLASHVGGAGTFATDGYYDQSKISFGRDDTQTLPNGQVTSNRISSFCAACHGTFHGGSGTLDTGTWKPAGASGDFIRHPSAGTDMTSGTGGTASRFFDSGSKNHVKTAAKNFDPSVSGNPTPFCLTCHKAHGNKNAFSLIFLDRRTTGAYDEQGSTTGAPIDPSVGLPNLCHQCHGMGGG